MKKFDQADYDKVSSYEKQFSNAVNSSFCTGLTKKAIEDIGSVYLSCLDKRVNTSCNSCLMTMMTAVGRLYFSYKKKLEEQEKEGEDQPKTETKKKSKKKNTTNTKETE